MARVMNVINLCYEHLEWRDDNLCIYFSQTKTDQLARLNFILLFITYY